MKKLALVALLVFGIFALALVYKTPTVSAAPAFEDPQICLNGKLLMVEPTTAPLEAWIDVGPGVHVDFNVAHCGGNPNLPVFAADHVLHTLPGNWGTLVVVTKKHTDVNILWDGTNYTFNSGNDRLITIVKRID